MVGPSKQLLGGTTPTPSAVTLMRTLCPLSLRFLQVFLLISDCIGQDCPYSDISPSEAYLLSRTKPKNLTEIEIRSHVGPSNFRPQPSTSTEMLPVAKILVIFSAKTRVEDRDSRATVFVDTFHFLALRRSRIRIDEGRGLGCC